MHDLFALLGARPEVRAPENIDLLQQTLGVTVVDDPALLKEIGPIRNLQRRRSRLFRWSATAEIPSRRFGCETARSSRAVVFLDPPRTRAALRAAS